MKKRKLLTVIMAVLLIFTGCSGGGNNQEATGIGTTDAVKSLISQSEGNTEYYGAVTPQIRQAGNRLSGLTETACASLLA